MPPHRSTAARRRTARHVRMAVMLATALVFTGACSDDDDDAATDDTGAVASDSRAASPTSPAAASTGSAPDTRGGESSEPAATTGATEAAAEGPAEEPTGEPILLSGMAPVEGITAQPEVFAGLDAAIQAINEGGGIPDPAGGPNRPLELVRCEATGATTDPGFARQCAEDAVGGRGHRVNVGKYLFSQEGTKVFEQAQVPLLGAFPIEAEDFINPAVFPLSGGAATEVPAAAVNAVEKGATTIGFISADNPAGRAIPGFITPILGDAASITVEQYIPLDPSADVTPFVARIASDNPDAVIMAQTSDNIVKLTQALRQAGYQGMIGATSAGINATVIEQLGDSAEGLLSASGYEAVTSTDNEIIAQFVDEMAAFDEEAALSEFSLNAWLSVHYLADVLAELPQLDGPTLFAALQGREADLGVAPTFVLGEPDNYLQLPRVPRGTVQLQEVRDGEVVASTPGEFVDLNDLAGG